MIKVILFDLDGTLLPMDQDKFVNEYLSTLAKKASKYGYDSNRLISTIWKGTKNMVTNNGTQTNETVFWNTFKEEYGQDALLDKYIFDEYYVNEFQTLKKVCGFDAMSRCVIDILKSKGYRLVLATNPLFPSVSTESRMHWAGLDKEDFELYTTYEASHYCKPNLNYYQEILKNINCKPEECLMVGNDIDEDMVVTKLGMKVFLLTDCLINKNNVDITQYKNGNFKDLISYIDELVK